MQYVIHSRLSDKVRLDESEQFDVTGRKSEHHAREHTVRVDTFRPVTDSVYIPNQGMQYHAAVEMMGPRVLKSGGLGERGSVVLRLTDPQVPERVVDGVVRLNAHVSSLQDAIDSYKHTHGITS